LSLENLKITSKKIGDGEKGEATGAGKGLWSL
jgi:hypothetical protein